MFLNKGGIVHPMDSNLSEKKGAGGMWREEDVKVFFKIL